MIAEGRPGKSAPQPNLDTVTVPRQRVKIALLTVVPRSYIVHGTRGRVRVLMLVRCPFCASTHQHSAGIVFAEGKRTAGCHQGRYVVRLGAVRGEAA